MKNDLEFLTNKEITRRDVLRIGFTTLGSLFVPSYLSSCGGGGSEDTTPGPSPNPNPNPQPQNNNPIINTSSLPDADEATSYAAQISASDQDNDVLTYNLTQKPSGMTNAGKDISWSNPATGDHNVNVEVLDGKGGSAAKNYILKVINKFDDISGRVNDILNGNSVQGADVILGHRDNGNFVADYTVRTDSQGNYVHQRIPTSRNWLVKIVHSNYNTHLAGSLQTNKDENNVDLELIPTSFNMAFFDEIMRPQNRSDPSKNGVTQKWEPQPTKVYIDVGRKITSGPTPDPIQVQKIKAVFTNRELPPIANGYWDINNIQIDDTGVNPAPARGELGVIIVFWGSQETGGYRENNNFIYNGGVTLLTSSDERVIRHEFFHASGADGHSNLENTILKITPPYPINYEPADISASRILQKRPPGNRSTADGPDANPDTYRIR